MGVIDHHNAIRQGECPMSGCWHTHSFATREISESLGMLITNGFFASRAFAGYKGSYREFLEKAGLDMVNLSVARATVATLRSVEDGATHKMVGLENQGRCRYCQAHCRHYCGPCSRVGAGAKGQINLCAPSTQHDRQCWQKHVDGIPPPSRKAYKKRKSS
eukprot:jgi/Mesvir1/23781/Mv10603-RA.1